MDRRFILKNLNDLGVVGDFENYYSTMSFEAEAQIVRELGKFLLDGSLIPGVQTCFVVNSRKNSISRCRS